MQSSDSEASDVDVGSLEKSTPSLQTPRTGPRSQYRSYPGRFYVLMVTALLAMHQNTAWLTFGPVPQEAKDKYGLTDAELTLLPRNATQFFFCICMPRPPEGCVM